MAETERAARDVVESDINEKGYSETPLGWLIAPDKLVTPSGRVFSPDDDGKRAVSMWIRQVTEGKLPKNSKLVDRMSAEAINKILEK